MTSHNSPFSKNKEAPAGEEVLSGYFPLREFEGREVALTGELPLALGQWSFPPAKNFLREYMCWTHTHSYTLQGSCVVQIILCRRKFAYRAAQGFQTKMSPGFMGFGSINTGFKGANLRKPDVESFHSPLG